MFCAVRQVGEGFRMKRTSAGFCVLFTQQNVNEMETLIHRIRVGIWHSALRFGSSVFGVLPRIVIDVDSTVKTVYGNQQGVSVGYNPHKCGASSYHPISAFCAETKEFLQDWLRSGSAYTGNSVVEFMQQLLAHLPNRTRILFRGDSGFFAGNYWIFSMIETRTI